MSGKKDITCGLCHIKSAKLYVYLKKSFKKGRIVLKRKLRNKLKKSVTGFMAVVMVASSVFATNVNPTLADTVVTSTSGITYEFANEEAGFAQGTITINATSGNYYLYWADDEKALDGYYEIAKLDVSTSSSYTFLENIAIPVDATKVIAIKSDSEPADKTVKNADMVYNIPANKQLEGTSADKTLSFEALSDTQLDLQSSVFYNYSLQHFAQALEDAADRNVDFVTTSGDCINNYQNGTSKEWQAFQRVIAESSYTNPIYETNGNHSMKSNVEYGIEAYMAATGLSTTTDVLGTEPYYEITAKNGDHFLFVALEHSSDVAGTDEFSTEQLDWLEGKLKEYYADGHRIFLFEHAFFHGWGPGDDKEKHYYAAGLRTTSQFPNNQRFRELIDTYKEVFLYTGHSHLDFQYNWNYDNENGETANLFHIPATACTTHIVNGKIDYTMIEHDSQCYIVDCYDDFVISNGLNIVDNLIYPAYSYLVVTKDYTHEVEEKEPEEPYVESTTLMDVQIENATSYLYDGGAKLYFYNNDSGNKFEVDNETGIASIPDNATNLTLYRCNGEWGVGSKTDSVTSFWNCYGPIERELDETIFYVAGSKSYKWKTGTIEYPSTEPTEPTDPADPAEPVVHEAHTLYIAVPEVYAESGYTYKMNIQRTDGEHPKSARTFEKTTETFNGLKVYSYTFKAEYTEMYDELGISKIQVQCYDSKNIVFQYEIIDKIYYIRDLGNTIFVAPDEAPSGNHLPATEAAFEDYVADNVTASASIVAYNIPLTGASENVEIQVNDVTPNGYIYTDGAAVFVYDKDTGEHYEVVEGIATIPSLAVNLVVYRCDGEWNKGSKTDDVASYWNKWELTEKPAECDVVNLGKDSSVWISSSDMEADADAKYYLVGFFDGVDYEGRDYEFDASGKLTVHFALDSYVYVISSTNKSYWTNGWLGEDLYSATLYKATSLAKADKLYVPSGNIEFKLTVNNDGTVTLAYEALPVQLEDGEIEVIDSSYLTTEETVDVSTLENLIDVVYGIVINDYRYASFEAYANIKELYYEYAKIDPAKVTAAQKTELYNKLKAAYDEYEVMTEKNNIVTVYFCNDISWSNVRAHIYNSKTGEELTSFDKAMGISAIKTLDSGVKIYEVTINQSKWDKVVFTNGAGAKTAEITVPTKNHIGYYFTDSDVTADAVVPGMFLYTYDELPDVEYVNVFKGIMPGTVLGTLQTKVNADENLPKMEIKNLTMDLVKNLLTVQEWAEVKAGANLLIYLNTVNADNNAPQADKDAITKLVENKLEKGKVGMYIDLSLYKQIGDNKASKITNTNGNKVAISVDVPEKLKNNDKNINRMFYVVRVHDGKAEFLTDGTTENTLLFETDRFSTYAIVYNDVAVEGNPKTGDITNIALLVLLLSAGCSAMVVANRKRKVNI